VRADWVVRFGNQFYQLQPLRKTLIAGGKVLVKQYLNGELHFHYRGRDLSYIILPERPQPQSQAAVFSRYAMFGQDLQQAVSAPRWLLGRTWGTMSVNLKIESRFEPSLIAALRDAGHDVDVVEAYSDLVGHAGALVRHPSGVIAGATDPRSDGAVAAA